MIKYWPGGQGKGKGKGGLDHECLAFTNLHCVMLSFSLASRHWLKVSLAAICGTLHKCMIASVDWPADHTAHVYRHGDLCLTGWYLTISQES